jgi:hypothetical protein
MQDSYPKIFRYFSCIILAIMSFVFSAAAQSGGQFTIEQSVIASGGGTNSNGGQFTLGGTTGQSVSGQKTINPQFSDHAGFWNPSPFAPPPASVNISGRVMTADGSGIKNAIMVLTDSAGLVRTVQTGSFGYYRFEEVRVGTTYVLEVRSKRFTFENPNMILVVNDEVGEANFTAIAL